MITPQLISYIREQLKAGASKDAITRALIPNGWSAQDIADAFASVTPASVAATVSPSPQARSQQIQQTQEPVSYLGRKLALSATFIIITGLYTFSQYMQQSVQGVSGVVATAAPQQTAPDTANTTNTTNATDPSSLPIASQATTQQVVSNTTATVNQTPTISSPKPTPKTTPTPVQQSTPTPVQPVVVPPPAPAPAPKPVGKFKDGTYTGPAANAYYGYIQVRAVVQNGALTDVQFLQYPSDRGTSIRINGYADPVLRQEAIDIQSANVDIVSGATDSSMAFQQSLGSALATALN